MRLPLLLCCLALPSLAAPPASEPSRTEGTDAGVALDPRATVERLLQQPTEDVLPFGGEMTRPERIRGKLPRHTPEALQKRVEGTYTLTCTIHVTGEVSDCRLLKPLRYMEAAIMKAAKGWRFKPATLHGKPVAVPYTFTEELKLPEGR